MGLTARWGITLPLRGQALADQRDIVAALPDLGYTDAWLAAAHADGAITTWVLQAGRGADPEVRRR